MNISEEKLREIVSRVMRQIEAESAGKRLQEKRRMYLMCLGDWDERYAEFLRAAEEDKETKEFEICALVPAEWRKNSCEAILTGNGFCLTKTYEEAEREAPGEREITVYPVVPNYLLAKAALCMDDVFEARWLLSCIEQGSRAVFLRSGLRRFSGKEPGAYQGRILSYIRTVLEYGVEISDSAVCGEESGGSPEGGRSLPGSSKSGITLPDRKPERPSGHRIITAGDLEKYQVQGTITLYPGDQITDVAKDRAKFLKISVKRADTP